MIWIVPGAGILQDPGNAATDLFPGFGIVWTQESISLVEPVGASTGASSGRCSVGVPIYVTGAISEPVAGYPGAIEQKTFLLATQAALEVVSQTGGPLAATQVMLEVLRPNDAIDAGSMLEAEFVVKAASVSEETAQLTLGSDSRAQVEIPGQLFSRRICRWRFRGPECGYGGAAMTCGKHFADCVELGNEERFGGYPAIPWADIDG